MAKFNALVPAERLHLQGGLGDSSPTGSATGSTTSTPTSPTATNTSRRSGGCCAGCTSKGLLYRGHRVLPYCPRCGTVLSSHELALGYEKIQDQVDLRDLPARRRAAASWWSGPPRRGRCRPTWPWRSIPISSTATYRSRRSPGSSIHRRHGARGASCRGSSLGRAEYRARSARRVPGTSAGRAPLPSPARRGPAAGGNEPLGRDRRRLRHRRRRLRHRAHGAGLRRRRLRRRPGARAGAGCGRSPPTAPSAGTTWPEIEGRLVTARGDQRSHHPPPQERRPLAPDRAARARLSPLLALRQQADLLRARLLVRRAPRRSRSGCWRSTVGSTGIRPRWERAASASGWRTTWTGRSPATATGARRCRCGSATGIAAHVEVIGSYAELAERWGQAAAGGLRSAQAAHRHLHLALRLRRAPCAALRR